MRYHDVHIIINPAAGINEPILNTLNDVFKDYDFDWEVSLTRGVGDGTRLARKAVASGCDLVIGYGGDGTQMEIVNGLLGSSVPLAILPGGTGNAMAFELGIPRTLREAAQLVCTSKAVSGLDLARVGDQVFMLRAYTGPKSEHVATREEKDRLGLFAYPMAALRILNNLEVTRYNLLVDGRQESAEGLMCFVFNAGSLGGIPGGLTSVCARDGLLDVVVLEPGSLLETGTAPTFQCKTITIEADPPQPLWLDGEASGDTPCTIELLPSAIEVVTPSSSS